MTRIINICAGNITEHKIFISETKSKERQKNWKGKNPSNKKQEADVGG